MRNSTITVNLTALLEYFDHMWCVLFEHLLITWTPLKGVVTR